MALKKREYREDEPKIPNNPSSTHLINYNPSKIQSPSPKIPFHFQFFTPTKKKNRRKKESKKTSTT